MPPLAILVIEDNDDVREGMRLLLSHRGFEVSAANSGASALQMLRDGFRPSVILMDLMMPTMDGFEFRRLQLDLSDTADVPVILYSGTHEIEAAAKRIGAAAYLRKPFDFEHLVTLLCRHGASD